MYILAPGSNKDMDRRETRTSIPALFAIVADVVERLDPRAIANLPTLDLRANFDDDTSTFMTSTLSPEL